MRFSVLATLSVSTALSCACVRARAAEDAPDSRRAEAGERAALRGVVVPPLARTDTSTPWAEMAVSCTIPPEALGHLLDEEPASVVPADLRPRQALPDSAGRFELEGLPAGVEFELRVANPFGPPWTGRVAALGEAEARDIRVVLRRGITLVGRVLDEQGLPVEGVSVEAETYARFPHSETGWWSLADGVPAQRTGADGSFEFARLAPTLVHLSTNGRALAREAELFVDGAAGDARELLLEVVRGGCIEGTVLWPDGEPAEEFWLVARGARAEASAKGEAGRFRVCGIDDGRQIIEAGARREHVEGRARLYGAHSGDEVTLVLAVAPLAELRGSVTDLAGTPIANAQVTANLQATYRGSEGGRRVASDARGGFVLSDLGPGEWRVEAYASDFQQVERRITIGRDAPSPLSIALGAVGRIDGLVLDPRGAPVADAKVVVPGQAYLGIMPTTDSNGRFSTRAISAVTRLQAFRRPWAASAVAEVPVASGACVEGLVLHLREPCRLSGRVLDERGQPAPGVRLWLEGPEFFEAGHETDPQGRVEVEGLAPQALVVRAFREHARDEWLEARVQLHSGERAELLVSRVRAPCADSRN